MSITDEIDRVLERSVGRGWADIQRDILKRKLKHIADDTEKAVDYCRALKRCNEDVSEELNELETTARGLLLVALLLKRERA